MHSPTGYYAYVSIRKWEDGKPTDAHFEEVRPILHWNGDGHPVISDEEGNLVTPQRYIDAYTDDDGWRGNFEVRP